ncbi:MAG: hypothetical protein ACUVSK_02915, partial [Desulfotomaculales bacterium]
DLQEISVFCRCGSKMKDTNPVSDYYGPYSPYSGAGRTFSFCLHLFTCPACGKDRRVKIRL